MSIIYPRRTFLKSSGMALAGCFAATPDSQAQTSITPMERTIQTPVLSIGFEESGISTGFPVILLHGFPDDVRAWDEVALPLAKAGHRVLVPYLRGYGPTRFRDAAAPRMAEQAAIGQDVIDFADALGVARFAVAGYDWGGRAASIAAALHPDRVRAAVIIGGYLIQDTITPAQPAAPETERALWYQWYFNTERGRAGLGANRRSLCRLLWHSWSPTWIFTDETFNRTAGSFDNPDFVEIVIHSVLAYAPLLLIRGPRIAQTEVDVRNRSARLPVTARVGPLARRLPPGTTAALHERTDGVGCRHPCEGGRSEITNCARRFSSRRSCVP